MYLEYQLHSTMRNHHPQELRGKVPIEMQIYSNEGAWDPFTVCARLAIAYQLFTVG